jgi:hypothetical protein
LYVEQTLPFLFLAQVVLVLTVGAGGVTFLLGVTGVGGPLVGIPPVLMVAFGMLGIEPWPCERQVEGRARQDVRRNDPNGEYVAGCGAAARASPLTAFPFVSAEDTAVKTAASSSTRLRVFIFIDTTSPCRSYQTGRGNQIVAIVSMGRMTYLEHPNARICEAFAGW